MCWGWETESSSGSGGERFSTSVREEMCSLSSMFVHLRLRTDTQQALPHTFSIQNKKGLPILSQTYVDFPPQKHFQRNRISCPLVPQTLLSATVCFGSREDSRPTVPRSRVLYSETSAAAISWRKEGWNGGGKSRRHAIYAERKGPTEKADTTREASRADTRPFLLLFLESPRGILLCSADT